MRVWEFAPSTTNICAFTRGMSFHKCIPSARPSRFIGYKDSFFFLAHSVDVEHDKKKRIVPTMDGLSSHRLLWMLMRLQVRFFPSSLIQIISSISFVCVCVFAHSFYLDDHQCFHNAILVHYFFFLHKVEKMKTLCRRRDNALQNAMHEKAKTL